MGNFSLSHFQKILKTVTDYIGSYPLNQELEDRLNEKFNAKSQSFQAIEIACHAGIEDGVLCPYKAGDIQYGRVIEPNTDHGNFSEDLVHMKDIKGPHHLHPQGEIDLVIPISSNAKFDGRGAGWLVYGPDSAHSPTVSDGEALVLYLLPNGEIKFTRSI